MKTASAEDLSRREPWLLVPEVMDAPNADGADLARALDELAVVHRWLGGDRCIRAGLEALQGADAGPPRRLRILDVGSGGGELARTLCGGRQGGPPAPRLLLLDFNAHTCFLSRRRVSSEHAVLQSDAFHPPIRDRSVDVVHCGLFLHHFDADRAARLLARLLPLCRLGLVIGDLHRHRLPHAVTRWGARWLSRSTMVRRDAPLSVARGFRRPDLEEIAARAGFRWTILRRVWPWRWLAVKAVDRG